MIPTLRPYQHEGVRDIQDAWRTARNVAFTLPTGGGKTTMFSHILHEHQGAAVAIAHRQELVGQISLALGSFGVRHRIIGPRNVIKLILEQHRAELGKTFYDPNAAVAVAGVDTLLRRGDALRSWLQQVTLWVQDECFPAGTLVDGRPIETIRVGDYVTAFNERTGQFTKQRVVRCFKNKIPKHMMRLETKEHHVLHCTSEHPFWTQRGWVNAFNLKLTDKVLINEMYQLQRIDPENKRGAAISIQENGSDFLHQNMRVSAQGQKSKTASQTIASESQMPYVQQECGPERASARSMEKDGSCLLRRDVLEGISSPVLVGDDESDKREVRIGTNEKTQSDAKRRDAKEGVGYAQEHRSQTNHSRRQRTGTARSRKGVDETIRADRFHPSISCQDRSSHREPGKNTALLQTGHGKPEIENRAGSGRRVSFGRAEETGQKEGTSARWVGLDRVEIYERDDLNESERNLCDGFVYNIEVEHDHTYIANGIVVHNCHHCLPQNKWGKVIDMFPNAKGLGVTATPERADGKGLDGIFNALVTGPTMRELIDDGYLADYRIFAPPSDLDLTPVRTAADGDYNREDLRGAVKKSHIVGDVVGHYRRIASGLLGITFATDVETAGEIADQYNAAGVPAAMVNAKTPDAERHRLLKRFRARELLQLVNVDLFGEGFDVPAIEVVSFARPTASYAVYAQQFGRALRPLPGKSHGLIIDHVGNVTRHRLPDAVRHWSLASKERGARRERDPDAIPVTTCTECFRVYEALTNVCPFCGHMVEPRGRSKPEQVEGDLYELDPAALAALRGEVERIDGPVQVPMGLGGAGARGLTARWRERQEAQRALREQIAQWAGYRKAEGMQDSEIMRRFYWKFGVDVMTAQTLGRGDAEDLTARVFDDHAR